MLKPQVPMSEFVKFGFKKCKGSYGRAGCYYLCIANGSKMMFVSNAVFDIQPWTADDPRIHRRPNCRYKDPRGEMEMLFDLITGGYLGK